jgi:peptidoglycan hydrolase CwlO-like protein
VSALTKIFVVLNVILSIILAAGITVWVNRQQNFLIAQKNATLSLNAANAERTKAESELRAVTDAKTQMQAQLQKQLDAKQHDIDTLTATVTDRDSHIAQLNNNLAQTTAAQKTANDALMVAQTTLGKQSDEIGELRKNTLDLQKRSADLSFAVNSWTNKYEVANHSWQGAEEQVHQLQSDLQKSNEIIHKAGISIDKPRTINGEALVRVEGVVRSKRDIGGVPYATINVGSADQVAPGMRFKIIDPQLKDPFLGYLVVDRVEPNEAIGRLTGPHVNDVRPGVEVRTQL